MSSGLKADFAVRGGRILTLDRANLVAQALAALHGRIVAVGGDEEVADLIAPATRLLDLAGETVLPGFHDTHCHILLFGLSLVEVNVRAATAISQVAEAVAGHVCLARRGPVTQRTASGAAYVPEKAITVEEALRRYPLDAAYTVFAEGEQGSLEVGKRADLVILAEDPRRVKPERLGEIQVLATAVGGQVVSEGAEDRGGV